MHEPLEAYLEEIGRYLTGTEGATEILAEIRSHILEKAETEFGAVDDAALARVIAAYGSPRTVAEPYLDADAIIAPVYRRHLYRYLALVAAFHLVLIAVSFATRGSLYLVPFFFVPEMNLPTALLYVPMALVYDCGLVALFFYLVTRRRADPRLPWPARASIAGRRTALRPPRVAGLAALTALLAVMLFFLLRYHTVFFYTVNFGRPVSLLDPTASLVYSGLFVAAVACETACYGLRFVRNSPLVKILRDVAVLLLLWAAWNLPIHPEFRTVPGLETDRVGVLLLGFLIVVVLVRFLRDVVLVTRTYPLRSHP